MKLRTPVSSNFCQGVVYPTGTEVTLVESLDDARSSWLVEVRVPDASLVGGASYDVVKVPFADLVADLSPALLEVEASSADGEADEDAKAAGRAEDEDVRVGEGANRLPRKPIDEHPRP